MLTEAIKAVLMGIVEGITEWLPISSTGHMILLEQIIRFHLSPEFMEMFRVVIQLGAILAVVVLYFQKLWPFSKRREDHFLKREVILLWTKILAACLPAAVLGLLLDDWIDEHLFRSWVVAGMLILYGIFFLKVDRDRPVTIRKMSQITYRHAFVIGIWQVLAMVPGTSRSGATIIGGLLLGASRQLAAQFTFYLAVPVMFGASGLKIVKFFSSGSRLGAEESIVLLVGMTVAFAVSLVSIRFLVNYVKQHSFQVFGWYRILLGCVVLLVGLLGVL